MNYNYNYTITALRCAGPGPVQRSLNAELKILNLSTLGQGRFCPLDTCGHCQNLAGFSILYNIECMRKSLTFACGQDALEQKRAQWPAPPGLNQLLVPDWVTSAESGFYSG